CDNPQDCGLPDFTIRDILPGRVTHGVGPYFFATPGGVAAFDGVATWTPVSAGLPDGSDVHALAQLGDTLYAASGPTIYVLGNGGWTVVATSPDSVYSLTTSAGQLYAGHVSGVGRVEGGALVPLSGTLGLRAVSMAVSAD